jgi:hypothetical protein
MNKKPSKLLTFMSIPLVILLVQFFHLMENVEKYGDLDFSRKKEHHIKSMKQALPSDGLEKIFQLFFITTRRTITGKSRVVTPTIRTQTGISRIVPYHPKTLTVSERMERARQEKVLQELCET